MFEDRYEEARECFQFALQYCPRECMRNRRLILVSLVPVEMSFGRMPTAALGQQYDIPALVELGNATIEGNLRRFNEIFDANRPTFIRLGIYLVVEQVRSIVYRNLFKRCFHIINDTRIPIPAFQQAAAWLGEEMDLDEIEWIVCNLIFAGRIKGYLSHQKRVLVVGKKDPFPSLLTES